VSIACLATKLRFDRCSSVLDAAGSELQRIRKEVTGWSRKQLFMQHSPIWEKRGMGKKVGDCRKVWSC
jgi:uncharacterized protein YfiM (DUF2279 family)